MKSYYSILTLLILVVGLSACQQHKPPSISVAPLLDRPEQLHYGNEWETIQNAYQRNALIVKKNTEVPGETFLQLATIFIKEARVTGEHGHYYPAALDMTEQVIQNFDDRDLRFRAMTMKAGVQLSLHEFADAKETATKAIKLNPYNAQIYGVLVDAAVELGNYKEAVALADKMISIKPDLRSYARISYLREIHGDLEGAIDALELAIDAGVPGFEERAWAMQTLGDLYLAYDRPEEARQMYDMILAEREDYPFAIAGLGEVAMATGQDDLAKVKLNQAAAIIPEVGYYFSLAELAKREGDTERVESLVKDIQVMLADDVEHGHNMNLEFADLYRELASDLEMAYNYAFTEYEKRPNNIDVNIAVAEVLVQQNNLEEARPYIKRASITNSTDPVLIQLQKILTSQDVSYHKSPQL
ncbi:MAG: tetratricopeptide repeat protein [Bacteroidota bacterium]